MKLEGAEATVEIEKDRVLKTRHRKNYRHPELDKRIRTERTNQEKHLMKEAGKNGANVPNIKKTGNNTLEIQKIEGEQLKDVIADKPEVIEQLGENTAKLHGANIIHGDLTTRNVMIGEDLLYLIDFGLAFRSQRTEDRAVDIHLLKQVLETSHPQIADDTWQHFLDGYRQYTRYDEVMERLEEVEKRGRYK